MPDTIGTYGLHVPKDDELADVPADLARLATEVTAALNLKLTVEQANAAYQTKIKIYEGTSAPPTTAGYAEGDIVFVIPP